MKLGCDAEIIKVTDITQIASRGVMATPALMIDDQLKASGRVPTPKEIEEMLS
jgi:small redox-active disulfide protein 2